MTTDDTEHRMTEQAGAPGAAPRVEVGWLVHAAPGSGLDKTVAAAARRIEHVLARDLPDFDWRVSVTTGAMRATGGTIDPVALLDAAEAERDARGWDFVLVVTDDFMAGAERRHPRAVLSALLSTAVISARALGGEPSGGPAAGLAGLALHLFGLMNNLDSGDGGGPVMADADAAIGWFERGDDTCPFDARERSELHESLSAVSDLRVEEMGGARPGIGAFYMRSVARNRRTLPRQVLRMHPWSFPARLSRLTTAAGSALVVLMMTAETWEVAANLSAVSIVALALAAIAITSAYLLRAQRLLAHEGGSLREQRAVRNVGTAIAVLLGMTFMFAAAFTVALAVGAGLFGDALLHRWTEAAGPELRAAMAGFTAALSLAIGALGASFEPYGHFRRVTHIDAEL